MAARRSKRVTKAPKHFDEQFPEQPSHKDGPLLSKTKKVFKPLDETPDNDFGLFSKGKDKTLNKIMLKRPPRDVVQRKTDPFIEPQAVQQTDLLFLPEDEGFKYALVVIDVGSRLIDVRALKDKTPKSVVQGLKEIWGKNGKYLSKPSFLKSDPGAEFKNVQVKEFLKKEEIGYVASRPGLHRQTGLVERSANLPLVKAIFYHQNKIELQEGEANTQWVDFIPRIVQIINSQRSKTVPERIRKQRKKALEMGPCQGRDCDLFDLGDKVHVKLDSPVEAYNQKSKLMGSFRVGDLRFEKQISTITNIGFAPGQPPFYEVSGHSNVRYTKQDLLRVAK